MSSIRRFLVVVLLATITLINFLAALHGYRTSMAQAEQLFDAQLSDIADVLYATAGGSVIESTAGSGSMVFQVWRGSALEMSSGVAIEDAVYLGRYNGYNHILRLSESIKKSQFIIIAEEMNPKIKNYQNSFMSNAHLIIVK